MWPEFYEEDMFDANIVPCRGRVAKDDTNVGAKFSSVDLNRLAPLSQADSMHLSKSHSPPELVQAHMAARIEAARKLKYPQGG